MHAGLAQLNIHVGSLVAVTRAVQPGLAYLFLAKASLREMCCVHAACAAYCANVGGRVSTNHNRKALRMVQLRQGSALGRLYRHRTAIARLCAFLCIPCAGTCAGRATQSEINAFRRMK